MKVCQKLESLENSDLSLLKIEATMAWAVKNCKFDSNGQATLEFTMPDGYSLAYNSGYSCIAQARGEIFTSVFDSGLRVNGNTVTVIVNASTTTGIYTGTTVVTVHIPIIRVWQ